LFRDVLELEVPQVAVQFKRWSGSLLFVTGPKRGVDEENVGLAIVVEVENRYSSAHGFGQHLLAERPICMDKLDARLGGDIREANLRNHAVSGLLRILVVLACLHATHATRD